MSAVSKVLAIGFGGALGANARYWFGLWVASWAGTRFPWATLGVNLLGAAALGFVAAWIAGGRLPDGQLEWLTMLGAVGFLGGFTTFSTLSLEAYRLLHHGPAWHGFAYLLASGGGGLLAVAVGAAAALWTGSGPDI